MSRYANKGKGEVFYVYALLDTRKPGKHRYGRWVFNYEPFYIGKGHAKRVLNHLSMSEQSTIVKGSTFRAKLSRKILRAGFALEYRLIKTQLTEKEAFLREIELIKRIGRRSLGLGPLTNLSNGGEGETGRIVTKLNRARASKAATAQHARMTDEERRLKSQKLSNAHHARSAKEEKARNEKHIATLASKSVKEKAELAKKKSDSLNAFYAVEELKKSAVKKRENTNLERYGKSNLGPRDFMTAKAIKALNEKLRGKRGPYSKEVLEARNTKIRAYRANMTTEQREAWVYKCRITMARTMKNRTHEETKCIGDKINTARGRQRRSYA